MTPPPTSLRAFLLTSRTYLQNALAHNHHINLVIGNESADLDSICSTLIYAYLRSSLPTPKAPQNPTPPPLYIPILNIPRTDIRIRPELLHLLPHAEIDPSHLLTLDDLTPLPPCSARPPMTISPKNTRWTLIDHNALTGTLGTTYHAQVVGCIDHHADENAVPQSPPSDDAEPRIITKSGSCASLVVNHLRATWDLVSSSSSDVGATQGQGDGVDDKSRRKLWDAQVARLAVAAVLVDTHCMLDKNKVTTHDVEAVEYLEGKIRSGPGGDKWDREMFFEGVSKAKGDLEGLEVGEVLRKDYKEWVAGGRRLGVSSVVKSLAWLVDKAARSGQDVQEVDDVVDAMGRFARQKKLDVYCIMTTSTSETGQFRRELLLWVLSPADASLVVAFERRASGDLRLEEKTDEDIFGRKGGLKVWWQRDVGKSRKQVAPLLREVMGA